ncbi:flagellar motor protein MotB [Guyparkeria hydrothermalis]|uniref:flagellar motor protein MotB n=1 Tax=Guyparkeria TaxID=2035712 RepID=UPI0010AD25EF|nr:flagellar motor protein MotB [Guyparkeria sp. SB14A]MCL7751764.1 flagellar motor protein MotB [Guyparkeria hydrothermalis]TKA91259.1 flagellar motor protein MotB [Guyparkeria sp. SB14A]
MAEQPDQNQQIVIKKVKKGHGGHHGGAWKIAYADFVTAMMAFFLLMWLLGSMGEEELKGISEYFANPTKVTLEGGSNAGMSESLIDGGGDDLTRQEGQVNAGEKPTPEKRDTQSEEKTADPADMTEEQIQERIEAMEREQIEELKERLESLIEVDPALKAYKDQIKLDITRDGLRIQIIDKENRPMFELGSDDLQGYADEILHSLAPVLNEMPNRLSIEGHTDARPFGREGRSNWELSADRANSARRSLAEYGYQEDKFLQVIGMADALPFIDDDPLDPQNRRISMTVMKESATRRILEPSRDGAMSVDDLLGVQGESESPAPDTEGATPSPPTETQATP